MFFQFYWAYFSVKLIWWKLSDEIKLENQEKIKVWNLLKSYYMERHRFYHTFVHIAELLDLMSIYSSKIVDVKAITLAIIFHDVIYDPKSLLNEENSVECFQTLFRKNSHMNAVKVSQYIMETKKHNVLDSSDEDLKYFIDFDMSILGSNQSQYVAYAIKIRKEYIHVPLDVYCQRRSDFLLKFLNETSYIFATEIFRKKYENQARKNIQFEICSLQKGVIPADSTNPSLGFVIGVIVIPLLCFALLYFT